MSKVKNPIISVLLFILLLGCTFQGVKEQTVDEELNQEISEIMELYSAALSDSKNVEEFSSHIKALDEKYGSHLQETLPLGSAGESRVSGGGDYEPLDDLPIIRDGDIYLSGGVNGTISSIVNWVCPVSTAGQYQHGAILDLNKFDPTNPDAPCFQTAVPEGAGYETPHDWQIRPNVAVLKPRYSINRTALNTQQQIMDRYCNGTYTTSYGFFKNMVNIFSMVSKEDNTYWYCTKVPWRVYTGMGYYNIDSNSSAIDWTTSGLYDFVKAYYSTIYFWSSSKARSKLDAYISNAISTIVLAEEIYYSPYLTKYYEKIRY